MEDEKRRMDKTKKNGAKTTVLETNEDEEVIFINYKG